MQAKQNKEDMIKKPLMVMGFAIVVFILMYSVYYYNRMMHGVDATVLSRISDLTATQIVSRPHTEVELSSNILYITGFERALAMAAGDSAMADSLFLHDNNFFSVAVIGGDEKKMTETVEHELASRFFSHPPIRIDRHEGTKAYVNLTQKLDFSDDFYYRSGVFRGRNVRMLAFHGIEELPGSKVDFVHEKNFAVMLKSPEGFELVIAMKAPGENLHHTFSKAYERLRQSNSVLGVGDMFMFPQLDFNVQGSNQIEDVNVQQQYKFMLEGHSPKRNSSNMEMVNVKRHMVLDGPFLIALKKADSPSPYFLMWVGNHELLKEK